MNAGGWAPCLVPCLVPRGVLNVGWRVRREGVALELSYIAACDLRVNVCGHAAFIQYS